MRGSVDDLPAQLAQLLVQELARHGDSGARSNRLDGIGPGIVERVEKTA
jgi:hypothetical protein